MNDYDMTPDDAAERAARQRYDLKLIADKDYDRLFTDYLPVIRLVCAIRGLYEGETLEVAGIVMKRMWDEIEGGKDFRQVSVYGSIKTKAGWESAGALERRAGSRNVELMDPADIGEMPEVEYEEDFGGVLAEDYSHLHEAIAQLTEPQQLVIELIYLEDLTVAEVAEYLSKKPNAVSQIKFNALKRLLLILRGA